MSDLNKLPVFKGITQRQGYRYIEFFLLIMFLLLPVFPGGRAAAPFPEEMETPVDIHIPLFLKILSFDRNLKERVGDEIVMGIVYQQRFRKSLNIKNQVEDYLSRLSTHHIDDVPFRYISIPLGSLSELKTTLEKSKVDIIYITPLRAVSLESLASISRSLGLTSLTGVPRYCESGISVSIGSKGGNPLIIINLSAAQSEGADFSSRLLKLAKVIK
ncbi:MAG: DUF4154 domain-containing protein [Candidatus Aminicenantes bacterium]|nr:DUF4154 domain-containing protein [Candidatus Aminicenantes bacterium]NIM84800.1 DUF4154 domain-containing protein [Candidatus Aminicenantes bacterium]NIN24303.1 DUF4154 domain-containing protein [Candidatus Aminicenantes bacterium]NIN48062.1 DUF4154 domain-containing protein [Candidatus Aminicenantes bacterium]NIN90963.1 DUF4154 domain-containing protein [Candidatus Aminicenantes bacterium]